MEPAGSARMKKGNAEAVWIKAMCIGLLLSEVISHAAPTLCMNVPISETKSAMSRFRKSPTRSGRHALKDLSDGFCGEAIRGNSII
jgi:hypothetical protein